RSVLAEDARREPLLVVVGERGLHVLPADPRAERLPVGVLRAFVIEPAAQEHEVASIPEPPALATACRAHDAALLLFASRCRASSYRAVSSSGTIPNSCAICARDRPPKRSSAIRFACWSGRIS